MNTSQLVGKVYGLLLGMVVQIPVRRTRTPSIRTWGRAAAHPQGRADGRRGRAWRSLLGQVRSIPAPDEARIQARLEPVSYTHLTLPTKA